MSEKGPAAGPTVEPLPGEWVRVTVDGRAYEIAAACPHRKGRLAHGYVNAHTLRITCPLHRSTFDLVTGRQVSGPCAGPLPVRPAGHGTTDTAPAPTQGERQ
ncbi:Rieske (2Fe-2S) protein [Streptomyces blastmyceticus]|uniref:Rieske domain-containing protein n=1 Tax=Streptomyces blastmyceticus TaxID=68180 RepID=A0ABP3HD06_9ACTN